MKTTVLALLGITLLGSGVGLGWIWRGHSESAGQRDSGIAQTGGGSDGTGGTVGGKNGRNGIAGGAGQNSTSMTMTGGKLEPAPQLARRILQEMLSDNGFSHGPPVELFEFLQALAGCDGPELKALLSDIHQSIVQNQGKGGPRRGGEEVAMMVLVRLAGVDPEGAMDKLLELRSAQKDKGGLPKEIMAFMFAAAGKGDPSRVEAMIARLPDEESKKSAQMAWLLVKAKQDPEGVLQELAAMPQKDDSGFSQAREILRNVAFRAPEKALEAAAKFGNPQQQSRMMGDIVQNWLERDPAAATKWAQQSQDPLALTICLRSEMQLDLIDETKLRSQFASLPTGADPSARSQLAGVLAANLARTDLPGALNWANSLPANEQTFAVNSVGNTWIEKDPIAASEWLARLPAGPTKDELAIKLINKIGPDDPESALTWANSIQGDSRSRALGSAINSIKARDPAAAEQVLNNLSEAERSNVRRSMEQMRR